MHVGPVLPDVAPAPAGGALDLLYRTRLPTSRPAPSTSRRPIGLHPGRDGAARVTRQPRHGVLTNEPLSRPTDLLPERSGEVLRRPRDHDEREPGLGRRLPEALGCRQNRPLHARRELHRLVLLEDLRQGRDRDLGDAADRLSAHPARPAEPRAARLSPRRELQLVSLLRHAHQISARARATDPPLARGAGDDDPGRRLEIDRAGRQETPRLGGEARPRWLRAGRLGGDHGDDRRRERLHNTRAWTGPRHGLFADPRHVDDFVRRRQPVPVASWRHPPELLRLVLRPAAVLAADLGRADRRAGIGRLVQRGFPARLGLQRADDARARRTLLFGGALSRRQECGHRARL